MNAADHSTQLPPSPFILRQRHALLAAVHQVRAEDGADPGGLGGLLELDRTVDPVGVGAGERGEAARDRRRDQGLGIRGPLAEGEVGVGVEVSEHMYQRGVILSGAKDLLD